MSANYKSLNLVQYFDFYHYFKWSYSLSYSSASTFYTSFFQPWTQACVSASNPSRAIFYTPFKANKFHMRAIPPMDLDGLRQLFSLYLTTYFGCLHGLQMHKPAVKLPLYSNSCDNISNSISNTVHTNLI